MWKKFNLAITIFTVTSLTFLLTNCARQISGTTYSGAAVGEITKTYEGIIEKISPVSVEEGKGTLQEQTTGLVAGGVAGGVIGSTIGKGRGNTLATLGGAGLGALAGALTQKSLSQQNALEYVVRMTSGPTNGKLITIVQGYQPALSVGQAVFVHKSQRGRSRISPR